VNGKSRQLILQRDCEHNLKETFLHNDDDDNAQFTTVPLKTLSDQNNFKNKFFQLKFLDKTTSSAFVVNWALSSLH